MRFVGLVGLLACHGSDGAPAVGQDDGPTDTGETTVTTPACDPTLEAVGATSLDVSPVPTNPLARRLHTTLDAAAGVSVTCTLTEAPPRWTQLVPLQSTWRYVESDPGSGWADPTHDDSGWNSGQAPLVVGEGGNTVLADPVTLWFRTTFDVMDLASVVQLRAAIRRDDAVAVYLNGVEVLRDNLPAGALTAATEAVERISDTDERTLLAASFDAGALVSGTNTLAVELHQAPDSSDAAFDLRLVALESVLPDPPEILLVEDLALATEHDLVLHGFLSLATYTCEAQSSACDGAKASATITTGALDVPVPALAPTPGSAPSWGGPTLFNHQRPCVGDNTNRLFVVDSEGQVRWHYEIDIDAGSSVDIESVGLSDGTILWGGGEQLEGSPTIVNLDGEEIWTAAYERADEDVYHHDIEQMADGRIVGIVSSVVSDGGDTWNGFSLVEHDPTTGLETWRWTTQDAYDRGQLPPGSDGSDPYHANSLAVVDDADGPGVYVSLLNQNAVIRIDRTSGDITWALGAGGDFALVDPSGATLPTDEWFTALHAIDVVDGRLFLYQNAGFTAESRAVAMELDSAARRATLAWTWSEFGWYEPVWGDADPLPSGRVLVAIAHAWCIGGTTDHPGALVEVDEATGTVDWRLDFLDLDDSTYRAQRLDGCDWFPNSRTCPAVAERIAALR